MDDGVPTPLRPLHRSVDDDELRPVTALFADVVGSTGLGEKLNPAEVKAVIGECVSRMCEAVEAFDGHVTGQMGDGIAAFFGLHVAREDDAARAARAALEIRSIVAGYAQEVREAWNVERLNVRIGLNTGRVAAGPVGGQDETIVALGDAVNVAARLQSAAEPGGIVVGAAVADVLSRKFVLGKLGPLAVKGRTEPVEAFELTAIDDRPYAPRLTTFVGRAREFEDAKSSIDEFLTGRGQVVTIVGDGGIGKTRLIAEIRNSVPTDVIWLDATCEALDHRLPYDPIEQVLRGFLGVIRSSTAIELRVRFRAAMRDVLGDYFDSYAPQLARILGIRLEQRLMDQLEGLPPDVLIRNLHDSVAAWLAALSRRGPVALAIDNLHDAREATTDVVASLIERLERLPILLVLTMRRDSEAPGWRTRVEALANHSQRCVDLSLRPLDTASSYALVGALDDAGSLDERLREIVVERAEGNPLYIEQLVAAIGTDGEPWVEPVPRALESFLLSRIDSLSSHAKRLLQAAAVLGRVFSEDVLVAMAADDFEMSIAELLRVDLIKEYQRAPRQFAFRHGLLRDAAISTLTPERLKKLHGVAAEAIKAWFGYQIERDANDLAEHLMACGDSLRAAECLDALGDRLALVYREKEAIDSFGRALEVLRESRSWLEFSQVVCKQAQLLGAVGHTVAAVSLVDEALSHESNESVRLELALVKAERLAEADRLDEVQPVLEDILANTAEVETIGRTLVLMGQIGLESQHVDVAEDASQRLQALTGISDHLAFERASLRGGVAATKGDFSLAQRCAMEAQSIADELGSIPSQLVAKRRVGLMLRLKGSVREAYDSLSEVFERYRDIGFVMGQLETAVNLLSCAPFCGEFERGRQVAEYCLTIAEEPVWRLMLQANLAVIELETANYGRAKRLIGEVAVSESPAPPWTHIVRGVVEAQVDVARGALDSAELRIRRMCEEARLPGRDGDLGMLEAVHAEIAEALGWHTTAIESATRAFARIDLADVCMATQIQRIYGSIVSQDNPESGESKLQNALSSARRCGMRIEEAYCLIGLGSLHESRRSVYFDEAREILESCGAQRGLADLKRAQDKLEARSIV